MTPLTQPTASPPPPHPITNPPLALAYQLGSHWAMSSIPSENKSCLSLKLVVIFWRERGILVDTIQIWVCKSERKVFIYFSLCFDLSMVVFACLVGLVERNKPDIQLTGIPSISSGILPFTMQQSIFVSRYISTNFHYAHNHKHKCSCENTCREPKIVPIIRLFVSSSRWN